MVRPRLAMVAIMSPCQQPSAAIHLGRVLVQESVPDTELLSMVVGIAALDVRPALPRLVRAIVEIHLDIAEEARPPRYPRDHWKR